MERRLLRWRDAPLDRGCEDALVACWRRPTPVRARAYLRALMPVIPRARALERGAGHSLGSVQAVEPMEPEWLGPYPADRQLGRGGDGWALHARHAQTVPITVNPAEPVSPPTTHPA